MSSITNQVLVKSIFQNKYKIDRIKKTGDCKYIRLNRIEPKFVDRFSSNQHSRLQNDFTIVDLQESFVFDLIHHPQKRGNTTIPCCNK